MGEGDLEAFAGRFGGRDPDLVGGVDIGDVGPVGRPGDVRGVLRRHRHFDRNAVAVGVDQPHLVRFAGGDGRDPGAVRGPGRFSAEAVGEQVGGRRFLGSRDPGRGVVGEREQAAVGRPGRLLLHFGGVADHLRRRGPVRRADVDVRVARRVFVCPLEGDLRPVGRPGRLAADDFVVAADREHFVGRVRDRDRVDAAEGLVVAVERDPAAVRGPDRFVLLGRVGVGEIGVHGGVVGVDRADVAFAAVGDFVGAGGRGQRPGRRGTRRSRRGRTPSGPSPPTTELFPPDLLCMDAGNRWTRPRQPFRPGMAAQSPVLGTGRYR